MLSILTHNYAYIHVHIQAHHVAIRRKQNLVLNHEYKFIKFIQDSTSVKSFIKHGLLWDYTLLCHISLCLVSQATIKHKQHRPIVQGTSAR